MLQVGAPRKKINMLGQEREKTGRRGKEKRKKE